MTGVLGRFVSLEMALLGLCELALSFLVIYGMLPGPDMLPVSAGVAGQVLVGSAVLNAANLDLAPQTWHIKAVRHQWREIHGNSVDGDGSNRAIDLLNMAGKENGIGPGDVQTLVLDIGRHNHATRAGCPDDRNTVTNNQVSLLLDEHCLPENAREVMLHIVSFDRTDNRQCGLLSGDKGRGSPAINSCMCRHSA